MECVGALQALGNKTDHLDKKIIKIEEFIEKTVVINEAEKSKGAVSGAANKKPKGLAALTQLFWLSGSRENQEKERKLIRAYKMLLTISLIVIALG